MINVNSFIVRALRKGLDLSKIEFRTETKVRVIDSVGFGRVRYSLFALPDSRFVSAYSPKIETALRFLVIQPSEPRFCRRLTGKGRLILQVEPGRLP